MLTTEVFMLIISSISVICGFLYAIYKELKEIRLHYVPHRTCEERMENLKLLYLRLEDEIEKYEH